MLHKDVFKAFNTHFDLGTIETWWQNGYNSIRVRFENKKEIVFTYSDDKKWKLETIDSFINDMNKK